MAASDFRFLHSASLILVSVLALFDPARSLAAQVVAWGDNSFGQTNTPSGLANVLAIASGANHSLALNSDGTVTAWGDSTAGQTNVPTGLSNVIAVAGGGRHSLALRADGTVAAWGDDTFGQTAVPSDLSNVVAVAAGARHSLALSAEGTVSAWGDNSSHQLDVPEGLAGVVAIAAGDAHSLALKADGTVVAWGANASQQTNVPAGLTNVVAIAAGGSHSLALKANGWIVSWGSQNSVPGNSTHYGAAIVSTSPGSTATNADKGVAQEGNVVVDVAYFGTNGLTVIDGGGGCAVLANGRVNTNSYSVIPPGSISMMNWGTADQIPDYTGANSMFDFNRLIAVADVAGTHYTNLSTFITANNVASSNSAIGALEGVIVVDIWKKDKRFGDLQPRYLPRGINVRGTLVFNFSPEFDGSDKIINTSTMNVNPADLSGLVATDPATYTTGYPPTYKDATKNPSNVDISSKGFANFGPADDLPAFVYNISILDIHGNANICGPIYSPSFVELENKQTNQVQYYRGAIIGGGGVYFANQAQATSVSSVAPKSIVIAACSSNNLSLRANGSIAAWGGPTNVPAGLSNVVAIAVGASHGLALTGDNAPSLRTQIGGLTSSGNRFSVSLPTQSGRVYALQYKDSLADSRWTALPLVAGTGGLQTLADQNASAAQRFYRVRQW